MDIPFLVPKKRHLRALFVPPGRDEEDDDPAPEKPPRLEVLGTESAEAVD